MDYLIGPFVELYMSDAAFDCFLLVDKGPIQSIFVPFSQNHRRIGSHLSIHFFLSLGFFTAIFLSIWMLFNTLLDILISVLFV